MSSNVPKDIYCTCHPTVCFTHSTQDLFPSSLLYYQIGPTLLLASQREVRYFLKSLMSLNVGLRLQLRYLALCSLWACQCADRYFMYDPPVWLGLGLQLRCSLRDHREESLHMIRHVATDVAKLNFGRTLTLESGARDCFL